MKKKKGKKTPNIITPTASATISTHNYYDGFDTDSEPKPAANNNNNTVVIPDEAYLPNEYNLLETNHNETESLSSMGSSSTETKGPILTA